MRSVAWIVAGGIAAAIGAAIWAAIAYYGNVEIGWIAWILGGIVGAAVAAAARDQVGVATGVGAACIALGGVLGGKYAAIRLTLEDVVGEVEITEELVISYVADTVAQERLDAGQEIEWPTELGLGEASTQEEYPADLWTDAVARWDNAGPDWQAQQREYVEYVTKENFAAMKDEVSSSALLENLDLLDMVFFLFAVLTAYGIGSGGSRGGGD
jgi:phosphate/sulfate permease